MTVRLHATTAGPTKMAENDGPTACNDRRADKNGRKCRPDCRRCPVMPGMTGGLNAGGSVAVGNQWRLTACRPALYEK